MGLTGFAPRERAAAVLHQVLVRRRALDGALRADGGLDRLSVRDRAFARNLAATTLRRLGQIDSIAGSRLDRSLPPSGAGARMALRLGICQILFLGVGAHAAVDTSVALARQRGPDRFAGLVNAVLRRIAREPREDVLARHPERLNAPDWLFRSWSAAYGESVAARIAAAHLESPPLDVTVRRDPARWAARLDGEHLRANTVRLGAAGDVAGLPGYAEGAWWVQDAAAALPAEVLAASVAPGARICDMCAAPGGKTAQLAAAGFDVTAVDLSPGRLRLVAGNLARLGLSARLVEADAAAWKPPEPFDAVLLDAPCSATGTIRRHPDIPVLRTRGDVARHAGRQARLLGAAAGLVAPGGTVVYSVCSLEPEEGERVVDAACGGGLAREPADAAGLPAEATAAGDLRTLPCAMAERGGMDGFFVSRLRRAA